MQMWPGHMDDLEGAMEASRVANMLQHVPLAMSLCRVDYANHLKMQSSLSNHMYAPSAFEGILELRKEKSRDAARSRRGKENYEFYELAKLLPLPAAITSQLDKASIIRLTISYLKLRDFSIHGDPPWQRDACSSTKSAAAAAKGSPSQRHSTIALAQDIFETHQGTHILQSVDGFAFALSNDGRFLYISETVSIYLGLSQVEMAGSSIFEYIHSHDHKELAEQLGLNQPKAGSSFYAPLGSDSSDEGSSTPNPPRSTTPSLSERVSVMSPNPSKGYDRCFCIRMKSTLTKRGVHFKSSGYRVVQIVAHLRPQVSFPASPMKQLPPLLGLVGVAIALPPPTITELVIDNDMFVTRLSPQLKITYCEPRISDIMDITSEDFVNKNLYEFCHAEDLQKLHKAHVDLLNKGQVLTDYYRLMNRHGGYVWLQTCATIICNAKNVDEQNIIAINYVLSGVECGDCVMNLDQYRAVTKTELDITDHSDTERTADNGSISQSGSQQRHSTTASDTVCGLRNAGFKTRSSSCRSTLGDANNDLDGFLPDPSTSTVTPATMLSPPAAADARYGRRRSAGIDDMAADCNGSQKNLAAAAANSRRKADKPRKRKRATSELTTGAAAGADAKTARCDNDEQMMNGEALREHVDDCNGVSGGMDAVDSSTGAGIGGTYGSVLAPTATATAVTSPLPEDLSTVRTEDGSQSPEPLNSPAPSHGADAISHQAWLLADQAAASASAATAVIGDYTSTGVPAASSVHDLEAAMNKHLPVPESTELVDPYVRPHRSAIQWISTGSSSVSAHDATSTLLRSMYPSQRESVIRTNVYNGAVAQRQYYPVSTGDVQSALLTPPGAPESTFISAAAGPRSHLAKTPPSAAAAAAVAAMNHAGGGGAGAGYGLSGYGDAYAMTPPSSVSPQDVLAGAVTQYGLENADGFYPSSSSQHLHSQQRHFTHHHHAQLSAIKPLHYGTGAYEHPMSYHQAAAAAAMAAEYYSSNGGGSLASYSAHYRDAMKHASATW